MRKWEDEGILLSGDEIAGVVLSTMYRVSSDG